MAVTFPNPATAGRWQLAAQGWVGVIPLSPGLHLTLQPKVALVNLFRMVEIAYRLKLKLFDDVTDSQSLAEFYERLAHVLARRVLDRARRGLHRAYLDETDRLPYVRGRLDVAQVSRAPARVRQVCHFQEHTADISDNQLLAYTLQVIARSGNCTERVLPAVRRAFRALHGAVTVQPFSPDDCGQRVYHRLNQDYQPLHALCRFFLAQSGPGHRVGPEQMLPFLIEMDRLYEMFVAEWLDAAMQRHPEFGLKLAKQEQVHREQVRAVIDLVLTDTRTGQVRCVLDTKYKTPAKPANDDIYQVVAYAKVKRCREAVLVYPAPLAQPLDIRWDDIRVRSLTFALAGDLEQAGQQFLSDLLKGGER